MPKRTTEPRGARTTLRASGWGRDVSSERDRDEKTGNRYYQMIDHRCTKTKIGQTDIAKHWFVDHEGPLEHGRTRGIQRFPKSRE